MEKVTISNLQGESGLANVVRFFVNNGTEYLIYSLNEVDESGYTRLYVTKINGVDGIYNADTLNDNEWTEIKNLVKMIVKANKENQPIPVQDINPDKIKNIMLKDKKIFKLNTPLVNDLSANKPNFDGDNSTGTEGEQKNILDTPTQPVFEVPSTPTFDAPVQPAFEVPSTPTFDAPVQPTFEVPSTPTFDAPVQPTFEVPSTPTFDAPVQPTFEVPSTPTFDAPVQPTFEVPSTPTFDAPVQPTFEVPSTPNFDINNGNNEYNTYDFGATNPFENQPQVVNSYTNESNSNNLQNEIDRLNEELAKYKSIVENIKNLIEK